MENSGLFEGDPLTGEGSLTTASGGVIVGNIEDLTGGKFRVRNGTLIDMQQFDENGNQVYNPLSIGRAGNFTFNFLNNNRYNIISQTSRGVANRQLGNDALRMVAGPINVLSNTGDIVTLDVGPIPINNIDHTWVAYLTEDGDWAYSNIGGTYASTGEVQAIYGPSYRLASPEEAAGQAIGKSLYLNNYEQLRQLAEENNILDENGNPDVSGMVRQIMQMSPYDQLNFYVSHLLEG